jgi:hypothetical protein
VHRLIGRIYTVLKEEPGMIKTSKMNEARCLMKVNWNIQIDICEWVERSMVELV